VDLQREIQEGDQLQLVYRQRYTDTGEHAQESQLVYVGLRHDSTPVALYYFTPREGEAGFYTPEGKSVKQGLLRTPVQGAHITSGFGLRMHPLLGFTKMHKGVDFGAPRGTPVYAAGDGMCVEAGRKGNYGNYIRLRHAGGYETAYAHLNGFASNLKPGAHVRQGVVIGYVGTTGMSTGAHLHFEVLQGGTQVNPATVKMQASVMLTKADMQAFAVHRSTVAQWLNHTTTQAEGIQQLATLP
jgi:murein DD-endopeptidase MepM/ murein hydrolase activator NlpD